jgi:hypothetical protein
MIKLSTGKEVYANRGILGINPECDEVTEGYDGGVCTVDDLPRFHITNEEKIELADIAIERWMKFKERVKKNEKV